VPKVGWPGLIDLHTQPSFNLPMLRKVMMIRDEHGVPEEGRHIHSCDESPTG
jgi:hypothetical protein